MQTIIRQLSSRSQTKSTRIARECFPRIVPAKGQRKQNSSDSGLCLMFFVVAFIVVVVVVVVAAMVYYYGPVVTARQLSARTLSESELVSFPQKV